MVKVKICGLTEAAGVEAALIAGADFLGFVFAPESPRLITPEEAARLSAPARGQAHIVAVLANPGDKLLDRVVTQLQPGLIQLHGKETPERVRAIWKRFHIPLIKAIAVATRRDVDHAARYERTAAQFLFDAKAPKGATRQGGHGEAFEWGLMRGAAADKPWFLAGGLNMQNVARAIAKSGAKMVDVSSGVERSPGVKDAQKIAAFVQAAKVEDPRDPED